MEVAAAAAPPVGLDSTDPPRLEHNKLEGSAGGSGEHGAATKLQKAYRGYRTRRKLADSAVVVEELWWQAMDFARLSHSTVSFFDEPKPETAASRWNRVSLNASKVGQGLSRDGKALKLAFQHWIEAARELPIILKRRLKRRLGNTTENNKGRARTAPTQHCSATTTPLEQNNMRTAPPRPVAEMAATMYHSTSSETEREADPSPCHSAAAAPPLPKSTEAIHQVWALQGCFAPPP